MEWQTVLTLIRLERAVWSGSTLFVLSEILSKTLIGVQNFRTFTVFFKEGFSGSTCDSLEIL